MEKQADIRILIACHKPTYVPENPLFYPIQVGTALTDRRLEGMAYHDNEGDNISEKNPDYCELTAQYWETFGLRLLRIFPLSPLSDLSQSKPGDCERENNRKTSYPIYRIRFRMGRSDTILDRGRLDVPPDRTIRSSDRVSRTNQYNGLPTILSVS